MKLIPADGNQYVFQLRPQEQELLRDVLRLYPCIPANYPRLSRSGNKRRLKESQELLDEALAEQRRTNKRALESLLNEPGRFQKFPGGCRLVLDRGEIEMMLQVLNDIRVGCWLTLGSPEELERASIKITSQTAPLLAAMEACAFFQMALVNRT